MNNIIKENTLWINDTWKKVDKKLKKIAVKSRDKLPYTTINGVHDDKSSTFVDWWTNGFWGGMMWLMYNATGNEEYKITAQNSERLLDNALKDYKKLHHDVGFMWHLTSGANYRLTGDMAAYNKNLYAAATLASRYNIDGRYIRAWNNAWDNMDPSGWTIIDCMMNIPLLYWASREIGDDRFKKIAMAHADMAIRDHIREDGSVVHIAEHNTETGECVKVYGGQGYSETSCWTRGLAWAVYGYALSYIHTRKDEYLQTAIKVADYFCEKIKEYNYKSPVDFDAPCTPEYFDSTAGVCTACGLLEIAKLVPEEKTKLYAQTAINLLKATDEFFCNYDETEDSIVQMGTERYPHNDKDLKGTHIPIIYGDFFFVEALCKLKNIDFLIW